MIDIPGMRTFTQLTYLVSTFVLCALCAPSPAYAQFSGAGSGTIFDPYRITNCVQLQEMEADLAAHYRVENDIDCSITARPEWNDTPDGSGFRPIGSSSTPFTGSLNGQSYVVRGLYIDNTAQTDVGLFGVIEGDSASDLVVRDLRLTDVFIRGERASAFGSIYGSAANLHSSGIILGERESAGLFSSLEAGVLELSSSTAAIAALPDLLSDISGGGLVAVASAGAQIRNCYFAGLFSGRAKIGGIVGAAEDTTSITRSYAAGTLNGDSIVGGLVGVSAFHAVGPTITLSFSTAAVSALHTRGGVVGVAEGPISIGAVFDIARSGVTPCEGGGVYSCTGVNADGSAADYFYRNDSAPLTSWDFEDIWQMCSQTFPAFRGGCEGAFQEVQVVPASRVAGLTTTLQISFKALNSVGSFDQIVVILPGGFLLNSGAATTAQNFTNLPGLTATLVEGSVVRLLRFGGSVVPAGTSVSFELTAVRNPESSSPGPLGIETRTTRGDAIDSASAVSAGMFVRTDTDGDGLIDLLDTDDDNDGIDDGTELFEGSDPLDPGSVRERLGSTLCGGWNSVFSRSWNILEVNNLSAEDVSVRVRLFDQAGNERSTLRFGLAGKAQLDLPLNGLDGWQEGETGTVCVYEESDTKERLDGRVVHYRFTETDAVEFVYQLPLANPRHGAQWLLFNSYLPQFSTQDEFALGAQWVQVHNLGAASASGTLRFLDRFGAERARTTITLPANGRLDVAGHEAVGPDQIGAVHWQPDTTASSFALAGSRVFYRDYLLPEVAAAFALPGTRGNGRPLSALIDTAGQLAILELVNPTQGVSVVRVEARARNGALRGLTSVTLEPGASEHLFLNGFLEGEAGVVTADSNISEGVIAAVVHYGYPQSEQLGYAYPTLLREPLSGTLASSGNSFLGQRCELEIANTGSEFEPRAAIRLFPDDGGPIGHEHWLSLGVGRTFVTDICGRMRDSSYGSVEVEGTRRSSLVGQLMRRGPGNSYRFPIQAR